MSKDIQKWADPAMFAAEPMESTVPRVHLLWATPDPLGAVAAACRMYEGKPTYDLNSVDEEGKKHYWEQVGKTHLKAPLEFVKMHFFIEGVTRSFTHQMVRQRTAVYAQESLRFAVKEDLSSETQYPPSLASVEPSKDGLHPTEEQQAKRVWDEAIEVAGDAYNTLVNMGVPAEDARGLMPHAVTTRLNYCTDLRALIEHAGNRLCTQAQFEWRYVFTEIIRVLREQGGGWEVIADSNAFRPVCYAKGHCPFSADFDRGCTIRSRVDRGEFEKIDDREWLMDPAAARKG